MKKSLVWKLLPVAVMAAIGLFLAAKAPPQVDASVGTLSPGNNFVVNAGSPVGFSFTAGASAGNITITASSVASTFINVTSCPGCTVSNNGTSLVNIAAPVGTGVFSVNFTLDVSCTASGVPVSVTASQGNTSTSTGSTGSCATSCATLLTAGCCNVLTTACGCLGLGTSSLLLNNCGCAGLGTSSLLLNNCGCAGLGTSSLLLNNCGCAGLGTSSAVVINGVLINGGLNNNCGCPGVYGQSGVVTNGLYNNGIYGGVYGGGVYGGGVYGNNCGVCTTNGLLANCPIGTSQVAVTVPGTAVCGSRFNVLITVRNSIGGLALDNTQVSLSSSMGVISPVTAVTSGGIASASLLLPPAGSGTATISANANGASGQTSVVVSCAAPVQVLPAPVPVVIQQPIISAPNAGDGGCLAKGGCN